MIASTAEPSSASLFFVRRVVIALLGLAGAWLLAWSLLAAEPEIPSAWRRADIAVDGSAEEWSGHLVPLPDQPLAVGVENDDRFLYVCVKTSDEATRKKLLGAGLSVFLDASGKEDRAFGIRFPLGRAGRELVDAPAGDLETMAKVNVVAAGRDLAFLGREADGAPVRASDAKPVEAAIGEQDGALVVELKVPLAFGVDSPHAIETAPGKTIALGLETAAPKARRPAEGGGGRGGFGLGGGGMRGGGGGGMRGGGRRGGRGEDPEAKALGKPLKVWTKVTLAKEPAEATPPTR